jgi:peptidoglycan/LPS O-acetylase OafA/YrhL
MRPDRPSQPLFVGRVEALRGVAALLVAGFHIGQSRLPAGQLLYGPGPAEGPIAGALRQALIWLQNGHGAVVLFFVISGFVLSLSLARGPARAGALTVDFLAARLLRIYPAAIAVVLAFALVYWMVGRGMPYAGPQTFEPANLALNGALIRFDINGVMWTVQIELLAAPFILALFLWQRRHGTIILLVATVALVLAARDPRWPPPILPPLRPLACLYAFPMGMLVPSLGRALAQRLPARGATILAALAALAFFAARPLLGRPTLAGTTECIAAATLVALLAYGPPLRALRFLDWTATRLLGRVSYSFYLLHGLALTVAWTIPGTLDGLLAAGLPRALIHLGLTAASVAAVLPLALLSYRLVERPGIGIGRWLRARLIPGRPAAAVAA